MNFQRLPGVDLDVDNFNITVLEDPAVPAGAPQTVIDATNQRWGVRVSWNVIGAAVPFILGTWRVEGYLESIGAGGEFEIPEANQAMGLGGYNLFMLVPAGFVAGQIAPGEPSTPFKLTVTLTAVNGAGNPFPMAGYEEGPIIQFFVP